MDANPKSTRNRWRWTVIGSIAFAFSAGLGMSNMDYYPGAFLWGLSASGWSVIGFPILMAIGFVSTMPFNWLADREKPHLALIIGAGCYALYFGLVLSHSTPSARASWALGQELPADTTILALKRHDTFNDGFFVHAKLSMSRAVMEQIVNEDEWIRSITSDRFASLFPDDRFPQPTSSLDGEYVSQLAFRTDTAQLFYAPEEELLYVTRHSQISEP
ncbi:MULTISPECIES: hypothetical protein [Rhodopirellula]|uniref:hypothetical protein n=1 Tax=Rhodopirellula TaxID=265488 RepID=UPI00257C9383|nr:hypothetical protein [Rhodopirellula sp. UBA1907]|tara:strand:- start:85410 stop:86060 length:651 start_codon:yes stop_codon:yes gene_type:complete